MYEYALLPGLLALSGGIITQCTIASLTLYGRVGVRGAVYLPINNRNEHNRYVAFSEFSILSAFGNCWLKCDMYVRSEALRRVFF